MSFLPTSPQLVRALAERNYTQPTPVQAAVLADDVADRDLLVSAQTGSGKTVAYGVAIAKNLLGDAERFQKAAAPLALIVAPTRELALQVHRELAWLYQYADARVVSCVGGMDPRREQRELLHGAHIVVGTPGRLCDHLRRGSLDVSALKAVVLDEADEMLDLGFREDMEFILKTTPDTRRTLLFSATLPHGIVKLAKQYQQDALRVEVAATEGGHADIEYRAARIAASDVENAVVNVLRYFESPTTIIFCNTRHAVRHLQASLLERGFSVVALSGELTQNERMQALQALRDGRARICVATDVAARGIDLPNLGLVIHAELPNDPEVLQHRSGRTGRAGRKGVSVLLVPPARRRRAEILLRQAGIDAEWGPAPQADDIRKLDQERMLQNTLFTEAAAEDDLILARALLAERSAEDIAVALARLYRARLPSPEELLDPGHGRSRDDRGQGKDGRPSRGDDAGAGTGSRKSRIRDNMAEGSVWFRAAIGRKKNAEARWLLPMICRRGGIGKQDIGAINILDTATEFEVSQRVAESFAIRIKGPDKDDNIRIEALEGEPQRPAPSEKRSYKPSKKHWRERRENDAQGHQGEPSREERSPKRPGKPHGQDASRFDKAAGFKKGQHRKGKPAHAGKPERGSASHTKPAFGKGKKKRRG